VIRITLLTMCRYSSVEQKVLFLFVLLFLILDKVH